jgi:hypothetical protein
MNDKLAETAPRKPYQEVEGDDESKIYLVCHCGQRIKKRRDSFIRNLHVVICLACNNCSTEVKPIPAEASPPAQAA